MYQMEKKHLDGTCTMYTYNLYTLICVVYNLYTLIYKVCNLYTCTTPSYSTIIVMSSGGEAGMTHSGGVTRAH